VEPEPAGDVAVGGHPVDPPVPWDWPVAWDGPPVEDWSVESPPPVDVVREAGDVPWACCDSHQAHSAAIACADGVVAGVPVGPPAPSGLAELGVAAPVGVTAAVTGAAAGAGSTDDTSSGPASRAERRVEPVER
jgi:hypothetical protein